jgi:2-aminoethylphosphonate dioxygenase
VNAQGKTVLCRTENYANHHDGFSELLRGEKLLGILKQLSGEEMLLFKEKINYKLAGSGEHKVPTIADNSTDRLQAVLHHTLTRLPILTSKISSIWQFCWL